MAPSGTLLRSIATTGISDPEGIAYQANDFFLISEEGLAKQGRPLSSPPLGMSKPEGIAVDTATGTIFIVGEPLEFRVFKKTNTRTREGVQSHPAHRGVRLSLGRMAPEDPDCLGRRGKAFQLPGESRPVP